MGRYKKSPQVVNNPWGDIPRISVVTGRLCKYSKRFSFAINEEFFTEILHGFELKDAELADEIKKKQTEIEQMTANIPSVVSEYIAEELNSLGVPYDHMDAPQIADGKISVAVQTNEDQETFDELFGDEKLTIGGDAYEVHIEAKPLFRITPAQDAEYLSAVEAGDMEKAQRMVDEAAKAAGYTIKGYHGTNAVKLYWP